jgi:hypothetical protein
MVDGHPLAHLLINLSNHFSTILIIVALVSFSFIHSIPKRKRQSTLQQKKSRLEKWFNNIVEVVFELALNFF